MKKTSELDAKGTLVRVVKIDGEDFVCLADMAKLKSEDPSFTINHWMRNRMTIEYLGLWETLYNPDFKPTEFGRFREECGPNTFVLSPTKWINATNAIGIKAQAGRYGGTYARNDIAFKFAAWLSVEFELYLVKEFQRLLVVGGAGSLFVNPKHTATVADDPAFPADWKPLAAAHRPAHQRRPRINRQRPSTRKEHLND